RGRIAEARAVALRRVGDQRELRDDEGLAADVDEAAVEAPAVVGEDAEPRDLAGELRDVPIALCDAEQHAEADPDLRDRLVADADAGLRNALADGPHGFPSVNR